jgi:uncharacterized protein YbjQ (UPF0145 family)
MPVMSGLSGNEMYCLGLKGFAPGELVIGNSVYSLGFLGSLGAGLQNIAGGEVTQVTRVIHEGRLEAYGRMIAEAQQHGGHGITSVTSDLKNFYGNIEFLSIGTCVHRADSTRRELAFSTSHDGQELYCPNNIATCSTTRGTWRSSVWSARPRPSARIPSSAFKRP